jgi:hypothetical protein
MIKPGIFFRQVFLVFLLMSAGLVFSIDVLCQPSNDPVIIKAVARSDQSRVGIGQEFNYTIHLYMDEDLEIDIPKLETLGDFEIYDSDILKTRSFGKDVLQLHYRLRAYKTGELIIPGVEIQYYSQADNHWQSIQPNNVKINVESVFERSKIEADIKPIAQPIGLKFAYTKHILIGLLLSALFAFLVFVLLKYRKSVLEKKRRGRAPRVLLYKQMLTAIESLKKQQAINPEDFVELSGMVKDYISLSLKDNPQKLTTEEFLSYIIADTAFFNKYGEELSFILRKADLVKFANHKPETEECKRAVSLAENIAHDILPQE